MAGCSTIEVMISSRPGCTASAERMAVLLDSVPPEVKMSVWKSPQSELGLRLHSRCSVIRFVSLGRS